MVSVHARHAGGPGFESPLGRLFPQINPTLRFGITPWWTYSSADGLSTFSCASLIDKRGVKRFNHHHKTSGQCVTVVLTTRSKGSVDKPRVDKTTRNPFFQYFWGIYYRGFDKFTWKTVIIKLIRRYLIPKYAHTKNYRNKKKRRHHDDIKNALLKKILAGLSAWLMEWLVSPDTFPAKSLDAYTRYTIKLWLK